MDPMNQQAGGGGECAGCEAKVRELEAQIAAMQGGNKKAAVPMDPAFAAFKKRYEQQQAMQSDPAYGAYQRERDMTEARAAAEARQRMEMNRMLSAKRPGPAVPPSGALDALLG